MSRQEIRFCQEVDGTRIAYAISGSGPPLVKAAHWMTHLEFEQESPVFRHWLRELSRDHTLIRYDERGCGLSDWDAADNSFEAWVRDLETVVDAIGLERFPLLGISQGGPVAIAYAARHPERVSHLVLYGSYARGWSRRGASPQELEEREAMLTLTRHGWGREVPAYREPFTQTFIPGATEEQRRWFDELQRITCSPENAVRLQRAMGDIDVTALLPTLRVPTLVLHLRDDLRCPFDEGRAIAAGIPGSRFVPLEGRNHLMLEDDPAWPVFLREVREFLGVSARPSSPGEGVAADSIRDRLQAALGAGYTIDRELGGGGMSRVFVATDTRLEREVVVKLLSPELAAGLSAERFTREIRLAAQLQEPHIVPVLTDGVTADGLPYYTMPFVRGESLRLRIDAGAIPPREAVTVLRDVALALAYAHGQGVVHRDIKPENVLLHEGTAVVTDFGIAKALREATTRATRGTLTSIGTSLGTPAYMAPEQAAGETVDHRADLYAWGVMAYELLGGTHPFAGRTSASQLMAAHIAEVPRPLAELARGVDPSLAGLVMRCLAKDPADRPRSAREIIDGLDDAGSGSRPGTKHAPPAHQRSRRWTWLAVAALVIALALIALWTTGWPEGRTSTSTTPARIAVLPFENTTRDTANTYLVDGLGDALIDELSRSPGLTVLSRRAVAAIAATDSTPQGIGRTLGATAIVEAAVQRERDRVRIRARLTRTDDGEVLWSEQYDRTMDDLFALQDDITRAIAGALRVTLGGRPTTSMNASPARSAAYDLYLLAGHQAARYTEEGLRAALETYQRALAIDSAFAPAHAGIATAYVMLADDWMAPRESYPAAAASAERALALDATNVEALSALAWVRLAYEYRTGPAIAVARRAQSLQPNSPAALEIIGLAQSFSGESAAAVASLARARAIDPLHAGYAASHARVLLYADRYAEALEAATAALAIDPRYPIAHFLAGQSLLALGRPADALDAFERMGDMRDRSRGAIATAQAALGDTAAARRTLAAMLADGRSGYRRPEFLAWAQEAAGNRDAALTLLERGAAEGAGGMSYVPVDPRWKHLRSDERFQRLVAGIRGR